MDVALSWRQVPQSTVIVGAVVAVIAFRNVRRAAPGSERETCPGCDRNGHAGEPRNDLVMFDADDGKQFDFHADGVRWKSDDVEGEGDPPCVRRPLTKAKVEVGRIWVVGPGGGRFPQVVWVKCL
jgi:hypothetical protein